MSEATPTSQTSFSSAMADALVRSVGVYGAVSNNFLTPLMRAAAASEYTSRAREAASTPELWGSASRLLTATITDDNQVVVSDQGTPEEMALAEALEYGTLESPPVAVMRTYSAEFTEDYNVTKGTVSL